MAAPAEVVESLTRGVRLVYIDGFDHDADAADERVTLPKDVRAELALNRHREFEEIPGRQAAARRVTDGVNVAVGVRFFREDGDERRGVEGHLGRPRSS